ncbi:alanine acetyltransferase [Burkholderia sp. PAMC 28687]|uniref:GNAT family N-acetyltransferase n=1 Tax=Burkholderia sp. PAMC 28687 TaxID=1795874 RepID=UPI0007826658|nr:GNAT family N-acetyltransferase [Burkholderia sp. PAMC 28687]AMM16765.1 alanine acetyltransferase [Burkholderia sp. PAMC 28687]
MSFDFKSKAVPAFPPDGLAAKRVVLRRADLQQAEAMLAYRVTNRTHLEPWEPSRDACFYSTQAANERAMQMEHAMAEGTALHLLIFSNAADAADNALIGDCHFTNIVRGPFQACNLGYSIDQRYEGRGLMHEALGVALDFVFDAYKLHRVMASYRPENERSGRLLARLGFEHEGLAKAYLKIDGKWADHVMTSRVNPGD